MNSTTWEQQLKVKIKMVFKLVKPVIKIISSQEFIIWVTPSCTNRRTIWYNERTEIRWHTLDHAFVGDKTQFKLNAPLKEANATF